MANLRDRKLEVIHKMYADTRLTSDSHVAMTRSDLAAHIRSISPAVNSAKWRNAVEDYAALVEDTDNDLDWAYGQGSVWFAIAIFS